MSSTLAPGRSGLDRYFGISERGSNVRTEVIAGVTTFMTMAYILFLNPSILFAADREGTTLAPEAVLTVTALAAGIMTLAMGAYAKYPFAIAAGLGLNAVVNFQLVLGSQLTWPEAMGVIVTEGIIIFVLVLTKFRQAVMEAVPMALKQAIGVGIGLFIALIGFVDAGFVADTNQDTTQIPGLPPPPLQLGVNNELQGWPVFIFVIGLLLILFLYTRKVRGALLLGILGTTVFAVVINEALLDGQGFEGAARFQRFADLPSGENFELIGNFSFGFFAEMGFIAAVLAVFTIMLSDFFDTMGTVVGLGGEARLLDRDGSLPGIDRVLQVDSVAAAAGGALSASSNTTYIESASGIAEGGRTGLTAVVVGALFILSVFFAPLAAIIPPQATAPALVVVGFLMMTQIRTIPWDDLDLAVPAFLTMILMPFTYSITNGIGAGFIAYVFLKLARGRTRDVSPMMYVAAVAFVVYFGIFYVRDVLT
jgi:AGZA family xanthine/uracil permease-like MFS transporter